MGWEHLGSEECSHRDIWEPHSQPKGQVGPGRSGLVRFSGTDGPLHPSPRKGTDKGVCPQSYHMKLGYSQEFVPVPDHVLNLVGTYPGPQGYVCLRQASG